MSDFATAFHALTGHPPFPWQTALYERFLSGEIPEICSLPTGMGKTSIIAVWLIALAKQQDAIPRRLVYVVNRRTVVDQTTDEVDKYRKNLLENPDLAEIKAKLSKLCAIREQDATDSPLAISTLRGQYADNREWSIDPARPAVICGTVDMIGSRLLFSGYGCGFKSKPLHAGFLGQDVLLIHDEAHLEPAFQKLMEEIQAEQADQERTGQLPWKKLRVMELTATPRGSGKLFKLTKEEQNLPDKLPVSRTQPIHHVWARLRAKKALHFFSVDRNKVATKIGEYARDQYRHSAKDQAILIFVRTISDIEDVRKELTCKRKDGPVELREGVAPGQIQVLTGTMRGLERDRLASPKLETGCPIFARFLPKPRPDAPASEQWKIQTQPGTVYLICTSAGEVGVDISADHLVCDLTTLDSMAQRFGRVNRRGDGDAKIDVFVESEPNPKPPSPEYEAARWKAKEILEQLPLCNRSDTDNRHEASPLELGLLFEADTPEEREIKSKERLAAFAPPPTILPATDILFDSWALTTIREKLPGRPPVEPYLHGLSSWEPPQTKIAWREEVAIIRDALLDEYKPEDLLEVFPLKSHELLADRTDRVFDRLKKLQNGSATPSLPVWLVAEDGTVTPTTIGDIVSGDKQALEGISLLLPPSLGGLRDGMLDSSSHVADDVSCELYADQDHTIPSRLRRQSEKPVCPERPVGMRLVLRIDTRPDQEGEPNEVEDDDSDANRPPDLGLSDRYWFWFERVDHSDELGGRTSKRAITWDHHTKDVTANAQMIADKLLANHPDLHSALVTAARWHDLGKQRDIWQRSIGRPSTLNSEWYAKSDPNWPSESIQTKYRHEFGSLVDILGGSNVAIREEYERLTPHVRDLVLHLIAVHHGFGRPHFPEDRAFDPQPNGYDTTELASDIPRRFAKLQRQYGRWGLAYLESLLRAADAAASANPLPTEESRP